MSNEEFVSGLEYPRPFDEFAVELCESATRYFCILSPSLDHMAFDNEALSEAISALARRSRLRRLTELRLMAA